MISSTPDSSVKPCNARLIAPVVILLCGLLDDTKSAGLSRLHIQEISRNPKTGAPLSKVTINQRKSILRSFFSWLYEEEYIDKDPSRRIKPDKAEPKPRTAYKDIQIETLRQSCKTLRERAIIDLLTSSGIRIAECARLNRSDVDFMQREIRVFGKGEKWRTSYIDASSVVSLQSYLSSRTDDRFTVILSSGNCRLNSIFSMHILYCSRVPGLSFPSCSFAAMNI